MRALVRRRLAQLTALALLIGLVLALYGSFEARRVPAVREAVVHLPNWAGAPSELRLVLLSDIHIGSIVVDEARLAAVVDQVNALKPDLVVIAGDVFDGYTEAECRADAPALARQLARLRPTLRTVGVPGNHDGCARRAFFLQTMRAGRVDVLVNRAINVGGLVVAGTDDPVTRKFNVFPVVQAMRRLPGPKILISHAPYFEWYVPPDVSLVLSGHTHCGQALPLRWLNGLMSPALGRCGLRRIGATTGIVTAGLGTSNVPLRLFAPPDLWLIRLQPAR